MTVSPYATNMVTSAVLVSLGDILSQKFLEKNTVIDYKRTAKMATLGMMFLGPVNKVWLGDI